MRLREKRWKLFAVSCISNGWMQSNCIWIHSPRDTTKRLREYRASGNRTAALIRICDKGRRSASSLAKQKTRNGNRQKRKIYEEASLNCIGGKWLGFRSRAACRRSGHRRTSWGWGNQFWVSGRLLCLSEVLQLLSLRVLPATVLQLFPTVFELLLGQPILLV
jgi:hypothetical protein